MSDEQSDDICEEEIAASLPDVPKCKEPWTTQELLTLVSAVARYGDKDWEVIENTFKEVPLDTNLSFERYSPENCAEQYGRLAKILDNNEMTFEDVEKQAAYLESKMSEIHLQELQYSLQQTYNIFGQALSFFEQIENGEFDVDGELTLEAINDSDADYEKMYDEWLSRCNAGRTVGPRINRVGIPSSGLTGKLELPPEYLEMDKDDDDDDDEDDGASTSGYSPGDLPQTEITSEYLAEQIELAKSACALEVQGTGAETTVSTATKTEPSLQPFFNPSNLLKSASAGLFPFATTSAEGPSHRNPGLVSSQKSSISTVSSVTLSAPTLSKLLELPPSIPGKLPPLPTFHLRPEQPESSKSPHKTLVQQLEATTPLKQMTGAEPSTALSSAGSIPIEQGSFETDIGASLATFIKKEILEPAEYEEAATKGKSFIKMDDAFYSVSEITQQQPGNSQSQKSEGPTRKLSTGNKSTLDKNARSSTEEMMEFEHRDITQPVDSHSATNVSDKDFVEVAGDTSSSDIKLEIIEEPQSSEYKEESSVFEIQEVVRADESSALLKSRLSANEEVAIHERKESNKKVEPFTKSTTPSAGRIYAPETTVPSTSTKSKNTASGSCEFSFEEINFPIPKTTSEPTSSLGASQLAHKAAVKRKRDSIEHVASFTQPSGSEHLRRDSAEVGIRPQKLSKTDQTPCSAAAPDRIVPVTHEPETSGEKSKDTHRKSYTAFHIHDQSVSSEIQSTDKNRSSQASDELSAKTKASSNAPVSHTPEVRHIKQEVLEPHENVQANVCIKDSTVDQNQKSTQNSRKLSEVSSSSSSSSLPSSASEDATGNIARQSESPSTYQVSKSVASFRGTADSQESMEINVPEIIIQAKIKQEPPDSESESDTFSAGYPAFTPFSSVSSPGSIGEGEQKKGRVGGVAIKTEAVSPSEKSTPNKAEEKQSHPSGRRASKRLLAFICQETQRLSIDEDVWNRSDKADGLNSSTLQQRRRRGKTHQKEESAGKGNQDQSNINTLKETSSTESLSVNKKHLGSSLSQAEAEAPSSKGMPGPVRRGRPRRSKAPERSGKDNEKEESTAGEDFGSNKKTQQTSKQEKKGKSRNSSVSAERDLGEDESTTSSQDSEKDFSFRSRRNVCKGNDSRDKKDTEEFSEKKISELSEDGENSCLKNILTGTKSSSPENTSVSGSSSAKGKGGKGRWSPQSVDPTSQSTVATPITSDISDDSSDESDTSASTSTKRSKLKWINRDSQQKYKTWKKSISIVWREAANHKYANVFSQKVTNDVALGYESVVHRPMDLSTIKKNIESGAIKTTDEFHRDMMLMFSNAIMYNSSNHDVYHMAVEMQRDVKKQIKDYLATQAIVQNKNKDPPVTNLRAVRQAKAQRTSTPKGN